MAKNKKFICAATPIRDEAYCLERYVNMVNELFDGLVVVIDDRTKDNSAEILEKAGAHISYTTFKDFGTLGNEVLDRCREAGYDYAFILNPDESITKDTFLRVRDIVKKQPKVDLFLMARKNWYDLDMTKERRDVWPDVQCKIVKLSTPGIKYRGKVHEVIVGTRRKLILPYTLYTNHFNLYYYKTGEQDYEAKIAQYNKLAEEST